MFRLFRPLIWLAFLSALGWEPMTEAEWLACEDPRRMLDFLRGQASERKLRLFAVACCRRVPNLLNDSGDVKAVEVAERFADGETSLQELLRVHQAEPVDIYSTKDAVAEERAFWAARSSASLAAGTYTSGGIDRYSRPAENRDQAALLRCLFGNPFHPATSDPAWLAWNSATVPKLAQAIYDDRAFDRLPVLADALEDAGCIDADLLAHCRSGAEHVRGCWVVDLLLEKE
jgi:hypothetical protein